MKKPVWFVLLLAACAAVPVVLLTRHKGPSEPQSTMARQAHVQSTDRRTVEISGEVLDIACYLDNDLHGNEHKKCAEACIRDRQPIGLLADDSQVYLLIEDHTSKTAYLMLQNFAAERVDLTGELIARGGVQSLLVREVKRSATSRKSSDEKRPSGS